MRVPQAEPSVGIDAINAPEIKAPNAVPGAFGEDVAVAVQNAGKAGVQVSTALANHIATENYWRAQASIADNGLKVKNQFQDMSTSTEPITTFKPAGAPSNTGPFTPPTSDQQNLIGQPKGYLNRVGFNATGSTKDFIAKAQPIKDQFLAPYKNNPRLLAEATEHFNTVYNSYYNQVSKHEATQYRLGMNNTFNAQTVSTIQNTSAAVDPKSLMAGIDQIEAATFQQYKYKGADDAVIDIATQKNVGDAVSKAVVNKLQSTGDLAQAQAMLDTVKDKLPADRYEKISNMLTTGHTRIQQQAQIASVQKQISGQANLLTQLAGGKGGWMNMDDMANLVAQGTVSEKFARAYSDVISAKGGYQPKEERNENFPKFIDAIYHAKDQTSLHDTLIDLMQQHKGMSQDAMAVLINSAIKRSGSLPLDVKFQSAGATDPKQLNIDAGARAVANFGRRNGMDPNEIGFLYSNYYAKVSKGTPVHQAIDEAQRQYAIAKYPIVATMEGTPTAIATPSSGVKYLNFNSNATVYPARIWNPKTGVFDVNTNRGKSAGGQKQEAK